MPQASSRYYIRVSRITAEIAGGLHKIQIPGAKFKIKSYSTMPNDHKGVFHAADAESSMSFLEEVDEE